MNISIGGVSQKRSKSLGNTNVVVQGLTQDEGDEVEKVVVTPWSVECQTTECGLGRESNVNFLKQGCGMIEGRVVLHPLI